MTYKFQNLNNAKSFADRAVKPMFIFHAASLEDAQDVLGIYSNE